MKLIDSPKVDLKKKLKYDDMPDNATPDIRVERPTGEVRVKDIEPHTSPAQPEPDSGHGAQDARERKPESKGVTAGHHVAAGGDPDGNRVDYVKSEYARNDSKVRGESARKTMKEAVKGKSL